MLQALLNNLPHGSGIDDRWSFQICRDSVRLYNAYHCMTDNGFYDGWANFVIIISKDALLREMNQSIANSFKLQFIGRHSQYLAQKYFLREYLTDTFAEFFRGL